MPTFVLLISVLDIVKILCFNFQILEFSNFQIV